MKKTSELDVRGTLVRVMKIGGEDYVCLTDMAKLKSEDPSFTINHWMRNRMTIEYLGLWEELYNPNFKPTEFGRFREESGLNSFTLSPTKWIESVSAIGIVAQAGRYGGTYARNDIAFIPGLPWLSVVALSLQDGWSAQGVAGLPVPSLSALPPRSSPQRFTLQLLRTYRPPEWCHVASRCERRRII